MKKELKQESNENKNASTYTVREGKIIEISKDQIKPQETKFDSRAEAVTYKVALNSTHNFTKEDRKVLSENFKEITSKAYKNYPEGMQKTKSSELKNSMKQQSLAENIKSFCKGRDSKQKAPEKSLGIEK